MKDRQIFHPMNPSNLLLRVNNIHHRCRPTHRECQQASEQKGYAEEVFHCVTIFLIFSVSLLPARLCRWGKARGSE